MALLADGTAPGDAAFPAGCVRLRSLYLQESYALPAALGCAHERPQ